MSAAKFFQRFGCVSVLVVGVILATRAFCQESRRDTPLVRVIEQIEPAVIALFVPLEEQGRFGTGSGTIIHPEGYVLTNNHVLPKSEGYAVFRGKAVRFSVVGRLPEKDIALLKLHGLTGPLPIVPLGHSHDVKNGETVVVAGNPGGRGVVFTAGIVSSKGVILDAPNALAMTQFSVSRRDLFIQFDAASNRGNSGGPLVNLDGELIGVVSALIPQEQNSSFAIPVDRVRDKFQLMLEPQVVFEKTLGVQLSPQADQTIITEIEANSPAAKSGLQVGDRMISVNGLTLHHAPDWWMALHYFLPMENPLEVLAQRGENRIPVRLVPEKLPPWEPIAVTDTVPGLTYSFYHGQFNQLPDFSSLTPEKTGAIEKIELTTICNSREENFAIKLNGWLKLEETGLFRMTIISDDGSKLYFHDHLFIDHDGNHPPMPSSRLMRAKAGLHPICIEYYQGMGQQALELWIEPISDKDSKQFEPTFVRPQSVPAE